MTQTHILNRNTAGPKHTLLSDTHTPCRLNSWKQPQKNTPTPPPPPPWNAQNYSTGNLPRCSGDPRPAPVKSCLSREHSPSRVSPECRSAGHSSHCPPCPPRAPERLQLSIFPPDTLRRKGPHKGAQEPPLWTKYVARCHGFCTGLCPCRVLFLAAIPSFGPLPCSGGPSPDLAWGPRVGIAVVVPGGPPRPSISLCGNQPSLSLFSGPHFPVTLLSNNFHVQFHFFSSSETSKLSARG